MFIFFRKWPLTIKLLLIGIVPILLLIYFSFVIIHEKAQNVKLIGNSIETIEQSYNIKELILNLGRERRFSYQYLLKKDSLVQLIDQRLRTDSSIKVLTLSHDPALNGFTKYTFLDELDTTRSYVDSDDTNQVNNVIQYYTNAVFRLNTLNSFPIPDNVLLQPIYQDFAAQRILSEMLMHLGVLRANIYTSLYSKGDLQSTLIATLPSYKIFNSYEKEFQLKASSNSRRIYDSVKNSSSYKPMIQYIDRLFQDKQFDSSFEAEKWWYLSANGIAALKDQQASIWKSVDFRMKKLYNNEKSIQKETLFFLLMSVFLVICFVIYIINHINLLLRELKLAARKISKGGTGIHLKYMPYGVIGNLAKSILQIEKNNLKLAKTANEIGTGNFYVEVSPRSSEDLLGKSIQQMQRDLREFNSQKDKIQLQTLELVHRRDEFFSMTSHELKTPITSLKAYTQLLLMDVSEKDINLRTEMLEKMDHQINKLVILINDLLDTSRLQYDQIHYYKLPLKLNKLVSEIISDIQLSNKGHQIIFQKNINVTVNADHYRLGQVVSNLLLNAAKYAPDNKEIIVRLDKKDDKVICSVKDFGCGIKQSEHEKIFERFYRVSGGNLHTYPGLGLGLFISKQIIEKHNGRLWLESEPGKGSTFYFELPVMDI